MTKIIKRFLLTMFICLFILSGCKEEEQREPNINKPVRLKEITGIIEKVTLDKNGDIIINKADVTKEVRYYSYEYEGVVISLLAVRDSNDNVIVVINTCGSCGGSPYAYFVSVNEEYIQCQNCGNLFAINSLNDLTPDGCNPIRIKNKTENKNTITISHSELEEYKDKFENWEGPK